MPPPRASVRKLDVHCRIRTRRSQTSNPRRSVSFGIRSGVGFSLIELLCVIAIIGILASLLLPVVFKAYDKARGMSEELEGPSIMFLIRQSTQDYCTGHTQYLFLSKSDLINKVSFAPKPHDWLAASATDFVPFGYLDDTNKTVLIFHIGRKHGTVYALSKGDLTVPRE
jgi:prepilin-type N-terminal cleavage/methylation domain-containing protein